MAKDDYEVIVYKILLYYYAVMKRKVTFTKETFSKTISKAEIPEEYLADIFRLMQSEGLIEGACFTGAWGGIHIMASDESDVSITAAGIRYLKENSRMNKVGEALSKTPGLVASLIEIVKPF